MAPLHITRIATVVSLTQLLDDCETAQPLTPGIQLAPEAAVASVAGTRLPAYSCAIKGQAGNVPRVSSAQDFARVPEMHSDDNRWVGLSIMSCRSWCRCIRCS